jgi:GAF domain-containing protein
LDVTLHYALGCLDALAYFTHPPAMSGSAQTRRRRASQSPAAVTAATIQDTLIRPSDLLVSPETLQRREQNPRFELAAFDELTQLLAADSPHALLCRFTDVVLRMYGAGSAGISVLRPTCRGHTDFEWQAVSGALAAHQGDGTPGDFSPCGLCLDIGTAIVLARPERAFTYLTRVPPAIMEILIGPLYDQQGTPLGALWVAHHDPVARFCADDVLIIERLAAPIVLAIQRAQATNAVA